MMSLGGQTAPLGLCLPLTTQVEASDVGPEFSMSVSVPPPVYDVRSCNKSDATTDARSPEQPLARASDRESRIIAEKQRRYQYNEHIKQIMPLVSDIGHTQRKVDKTSVLRLAANKLRNEHVFGNSIKCCHVDTWSYNSINKFFDILDGFLLAVTCRGRIFNLSPNIQDKLGFCPIDLLGQNIYNYIHPDDRDILCQHIYPLELQNGCDDTIFNKHHDFIVRILRAGARTDPPKYERCRIDGTLRRADHATANSVQDEQIIRRQRVRHNRTFSSSGNDYVFIGMVHIVQNSVPPRIMPPTSFSEYWTRHLIDGRIVQCDQSISLVAGYMTEEVTGTSAFYFMHKDDVRWVVCVLRQMYDQSKEFGESYYRLMSRSGYFIYMRTRGFLEIDKETKNVQSFVCANSVVSEEYGQKMMEEMKHKYSMIIDVEENVKKVGSIEEEPVENPKQLERIVMHLLEPSVSECNDELKLVVPSKENIISAIKNSQKVIQKTVIKNDCRKRKIVVDDENSAEYSKKCGGT